MKYTKKRHRIIPCINVVFVILFFSNVLYTQKIVAQNKKSGVWFTNPNRKKIKLSFQHKSNLIIIPVRINNSQPLNFILDTGVRTTLLTELSSSDSLVLIDAKKQQVIGLGSGEPLEAYHSKYNHIKINRLSGDSITVNFLLKNIFKLSEKLGVRINGLIGYDVFKNFVVDINYGTKIVTFHHPKYFNKNLKNYVSVPLKLFREKPYVNTRMCINAKDTITAKMLIDTGASDALWFFDTSQNQRQHPEKAISVYLGIGLNGDVTGKKGRISYLQIGDYVLHDIICSFPDTNSVNPVVLMDKRDGIIGAEMLNRFRVIFDYGNERMYLKRNSKFDDIFRYNKCGIEVSAPMFYMPVFIINHVTKNSPADKAGIEKGDLLLSINNKKVENLDIDAIYAHFYGKKGKKITLKIDRNNEIINTTIELVDEL